MSMLFKRIKDWATSITAFRTGDVIPVDGPSGTAKMSKDDLLRVTAQYAADSGLVATSYQVGKIVVKKANSSTATINYRFPANVQLVIIVECDPQYTGNIVGSILYDDNTHSYPSVAVTANGRRLYTIDVTKSGVLEVFNIGSLIDKDLVIKVGVRTDADHQRENITLNEDYLENSIKDNEKNIESLDDDLELLGDNVAGVVGSFVTQLSITKTEHYYIGSTGNVESYYAAAYTEFANVRKGDTFSVRCWSGSDCRAWLVKKSNGRVSRLAPMDAIFNTYHNYDLSVTIADDEDGGTLIVNTLKHATIECRKVGAFPSMGSVISDFYQNPLIGKIAVFDGDSICNGDSVGSGSPYYKWGWAGRIGNRNLMNWKNYGIGGGTLCYDTYFSTQASEPLDWVANDYYTKNNSATTTTEMWVKQTEETWDGVSTLYTLTPRHWESKNIEAIYSEYPNADYVILEACLNDGFQSVPIGTLESGYDANFEPNTWYRALQWTFKRAFELFPNAKIGIIIPHKIQFVSSVSAYLTVVEDVASKWNVPCLNLYKMSGFNFSVDESRAECNSNDDGIHLTDAGYEMIYHKILSWMQSL